MVIDLSNIYTDGTYIQENPLWHQEDSPWKACHIADIINKNGLDPKSICEIGCGAGEILSQLSEKYFIDCNYYGYEISPIAFEICEKKSNNRLNFYLEDFISKADRYDIVMAIDVFEHVEDYIGFLRKIKERGDYLIFHIPLDLSAQTVLRSSRLTHARKSVGHIHYFSKETALDTLNDVGYEIVDYKYTASALELGKFGWKSNLMRFPRKLLYRMNKEFAVRLLGGYSLLVLAK